MFVFEGSQQRTAAFLSMTRRDVVVFSLSREDSVRIDASECDNGTLAQSQFRLRLKNKMKGPRLLQSLLVDLPKKKVKYRRSEHAQFLCLHVFVISSGTRRSSRVLAVHRVLRRHNVFSLLPPLFTERLLDEAFWSVT